MLKEACFAVTTPYQLIGAIALQIEYNLDSDIYIFGMFAEYNLIASKLESYNIFDKVIAVDCSNYK